MKSTPDLIVMLTHNDKTVKNAYEIFDKCKNTKAQYWGFKEKGIPLFEMKRLCSYMKKYGKTTALEVVAYTEEECINGAKVALECGCDILMGTLFFDSVNEFCKQNSIKYMPFVGRVSGRPSVLDGTVDEMIAQATQYIKKGAYGVDLLAYRYKGNGEKLIEDFVSKVDVPVCIAGSINSFARLDVVKKSGACALTVGGAFFENRFAEDFEEQIDKVFDCLTTL